jgi:hypothetical protein
MRRWIEHLHDTDPTTGLPKTMVREHWDRRLLRESLVQRDNVMYLDWECHVYEHESSTGDWTRLRCHSVVSYRKMRDT